MDQACMQVRPFVKLRLLHLGHEDRHYRAFDPVPGLWSVYCGRTERQEEGERGANQFSKMNRVRQ